MSVYYKTSPLLLFFFLTIFPSLGLSNTLSANANHALMLGAEQGASLGLPQCDAHTNHFDSDRIHLSLMAQCSRVKLGSALHLKLEFVLAEGWQLYYGPNPGDIAQPSSLVWELPPGFSAQNTAWPVPQSQIDDIGSVAYKYPGDFALYPIIQTPAQGGDFSVKLRFKLQLCSTHCAVEEGELTLQFSGLHGETESCAVSSAQGFRCQRVSETLYRTPLLELPADVQLKSGFALEPNSNRDNFLVADFEMTGQRRFSPDTENNLFILDALDKSKSKSIDFQVSEDKKHLRAIASIHCTAQCDPAHYQQLTGLLDATLDDGSRLSTRFLQNTKDARIDNNERKSQDDAIFFGINWDEYTNPSPKIHTSTTESSLLWILLLAFLGGLLLNIMPCVLPVLSLKAFALVQDSNAKHKRQGTLFYALGIASGFWALGIVLAALKSAGELAGWGFQFQSPIYILVMSAIIFLLSLSLLGIFEIPGLTIHSSAKASSTRRASFMQGLLMTALSTPCSAPFLGTALVFALTRGPIEIMLILTFVAAGLTTPVVLLALSPALGRFIPKPGNWMITFKQIVGFLLLASVIYLLAILQVQISGQGMVRVSALLLILGVVAWILGKWTGPAASKKSSIIALSVCAILILASGLAQDLRPAQACQTTQTQQFIAWEEFSDAKFSQDLTQKRSILLDFTAAWCPTCKVNEANAIHTTNVSKAIQELGYIAYRIDMTTKNDAGQRWIAHFGRAAIPLVVVIPHGDMQKAVVLPEIFTESSLLEALSTARQ